MSERQSVSRNNIINEVKALERDLNFVFAQPSSPFQIYEWKPGQEKDALMKKETSKTSQLKVTKMGDEVLQQCNYKFKQKKTR